MLQAEKRPEIGFSLLHLGRGARVLELLLDGLGLVLADVLLDRLRRAVDEILRLFEAQAGDLAHGLDDVDLRGPGLLEDDRELGLLFDRFGGRATGLAPAGRGDGDRSGGHAPAILEELAELRDLEDRKTFDVLDQLLELP